MLMPVKFVAVRPPLRVRKKRSDGEDREESDTKRI